MSGTDWHDAPGLDARQARLIETLEGWRDPQARFGWVVEQARRRPPLPDAWRLDRFLVPGCQVRLWFVPELRDGRCWFRSDSDAVTLRALVGLLGDLCQGETPESVSEARFDWMERLGLLRQLAESRRATVLRVMDQLKAFGTLHRSR
jgi:cysteine desulfuration protein SufE